MKLRLPLPPSTNALSRAIVKGSRAVVISSADYRRWKADAEGWLQIARTKVLDGDVRVELDIYYPDKRRDADSAIKPALDVLQGWCYGNDRQVSEIVARRHVDRQEPRIELTVEAL